MILGVVRENFSQEQRDMVFKAMPTPVRQMWETMGEASHNALMAQVRQTA